MWLHTYRNAGFVVIAQGIAGSTGTYNSVIFSFAELLTVPVVDFARIWHDCKGDKFIGRLQIHGPLIKAQAAHKTSLASISQPPHHLGKFCTIPAKARSNNNCNYHYLENGKLSTLGRPLLFYIVSCVSQR